MIRSPILKLAVSVLLASTVLNAEPSKSLRLNAIFAELTHSGTMIPQNDITVPATARYLVCGGFAGYDAPDPHTMTNMHLIDD